MEESGGVERNCSAYFFRRENVGGVREIAGWDQFVTLAIAAGIAIGILNNPEKKDGF